MVRCPVCPELHAISDHLDAVLTAAATAYPQFGDAVRRRNPDLLDLAATAAEGLAPCEPEPLRRQIEFLAWLVERAADDATDGPTRVVALRRVLAEEEGFGGNRDDYHHPDNSYLTKVMATRRGLPITLSVIYVSVGRHLGWPVAGVDFPLHFMVRYGDAAEAILLDPFHGGRQVSLRECLEMVRPALIDLPDEQLLFILRARLQTPPSPQRVAARMLRNLERSFLDAGHFPAAKNVIEKLMLLDPNSTAEMRDLGGVCHLMGDHRQALWYLQGYLDETPRAVDRQRVEAMVARLSEMLDEEQQP